jgi:hypothetical protein
LGTASLVDAETRAHPCEIEGSTTEGASDMGGGEKIVAASETVFPRVER